MSTVKLAHAALAKESEDMPIALTRNLSNLRAYVNELFDNDSKNAVIRVAPNLNLMNPNGNEAFHWFNDGSDSVGNLVFALYNLWKSGTDEESHWNVPSDILLMAFMKKHLESLSMFVPALRLTGTYDHWEGWTGFKTKYTSPVYAIDGYVRFSLRDSLGVYSFLTFLLAGAHFVVVHNAQDGINTHVPDFYSELDDDLSLKSHKVSSDVTTIETQTEKGTATGHSHYTGSVALNTAYGYPVITQDQAPIRCPMIASLIVDTTASKMWGDYNTFFQLEGWPGVVMGGAKGRHSKDYDLHQQSKWNISTYGMCPYSEKRGTTIFLAPDTWRPVVPNGWAMPSYAGARKQKPAWFTSESMSGNRGGVI